MENAVKAIPVVAVSSSKKIAELEYAFLQFSKICPALS